MEKKTKFKNFISDAGKSAKGLLNSAIQSVDQNDDGKFDLTDVSTIAGSVGSAVKKGTQIAKESADEASRMLELKTLQPIFPESLDDVNFLLPKFIRIADRDKKRAESAVCQGSVGYNSDQKGLHIVNIFRDSVDAFGLTFYPDCDSEFYYVDPSDRDHYIALDEYFSYLKTVRINELKKLAQDLGAKYFKVTYKEEQTAFSSKKATIAAVAPGFGKSDAHRETLDTKYYTTEIAAEMQFPGHEPMLPQLKYLQKDPSVQALISMRMNESGALMQEKYVLKMSHSSGLKESEAIKIDAVLKGLKYSGNASVASEVKNEARRSLEYDIVF